MHAWDEFVAWCANSFRAGRVAFRVEALDGGPRCDFVFLAMGLIHLSVIAHAVTCPRQAPVRLSAAAEKKTQKDVKVTLVAMKARRGGVD